MAVERLETLRTVDRKRTMRAAIVENSMVVPQKIKNRITM